MWREEEEEGNVVAEKLLAAVAAMMASELMNEKQKAARVLPIKDVCSIFESALYERARNV